jgi:hypothetical protein
MKHIDSLTRLRLQHHAGRGREKRQHGGNRSAARPFNDYSIAVNYYLSQQFLQTLGLNLIKIPAFGQKVCIFSDIS